MGPFQFATIQVCPPASDAILPGVSGSSASLVLTAQAPAYFYHDSSKEGDG